jgi:hypothetical protein
VSALWATDIACTIHYQTPSPTFFSPTHSLYAVFDALLSLNMQKNFVCCCQIWYIRWLDS